MGKKESTVATEKIAAILANYDENIVKGIRAYIGMKESVCLIGETGTGKTTLIDQLAKEAGKQLHRVSVNGSMGIDEILGKWLAKDGSTYWIDGILTKAVRDGDWVIFDELNAMLPEMGFALHSLLDDAKSITLAEKDGEVIKAHDEFRFFGGMNPSDDYAGTKEVNMALMSRFGGVFYIDVFPSHHELEILKRHGVEESNATKLVNFANQLRDMRKKGDLYTFCSTRDIIQAGKAASNGLDLTHAIESSVLNKMTQEEKDDIKKSKALEAYLGGKVYKNPEVEKLEKEKEELKKTVTQYKDAFAKENAERVKLHKELDSLKKGGTSINIDGIDPRKLLLLKRLMPESFGITA